MTHQRRLLRGRAEQICHRARSFFIFSVMIVDSALRLADAIHKAILWVNYLEL
jgi:hypothetical protein